MLTKKLSVGWLAFSVLSRLLEKNSQQFFEL